MGSQGRDKMKKNILEFECVGMRDGEKFPVEHTGRGRDVSPEFLLKNLSSQAVTLVITLEDLSHLIPGFTHWVIWNIPASDRIAGVIPPGKTVPSLENTVQGIGYGVHRYAGPKPPKGKTHKYCFTIYALDCRIDVKACSAKRKVLSVAKEHVIQQGRIYGYFE